MYGRNAPRQVDPDNLFFVQVDASKCQACGECENHCATGAIQPVNAEGIRQVINPAACMNCGQCLIHCPYGAIYDGVSFVDEIFAKLKDPDTIVVSMPALAVRYGLAESLGQDTGTYVGGKMHAALKALGFDYVWDNEFTADVPIPGFGAVKVAVASGLSNTAKLCDAVRAGKSPYHFIEIMACPGGCVNDGGRPLDPEIRNAALACKPIVVAINKRLQMGHCG